MKRWLIIALALSLGTVSALAAGSRHSASPGIGTYVPQRQDNPCPGSSLLLTFDGSPEDASAWLGVGVAPPYYGAWAEGYDALGTVCGIRYYFTAVEGYSTPGMTMDAYLFDSDGSNPTTVLTVNTGIDPGSIPYWNDFTSVDVAMTDTPVNGPFFVGFWGDWPGAEWPGWYTCFDLDGPQGMSRTNIAPGIGYPTGWQDVSTIFEPIRNLGIGAYVMSSPVPVARSTWGAIKSLYR